MNCTNEWTASVTAKLLGKQNRKAVSLLSQGKVILFAHWKGKHHRTIGQRQKIL